MRLREKSGRVVCGRVESVRVEDVDEDDENRLEQTRQDLIYTNSSVFGLVSFLFFSLLLYLTMDTWSITQTKLFKVFGC